MLRVIAAVLIGSATTLRGQQPAHKPACETVEFHFEREGAPPSARHYVRPDTNLRVALNYAVIVDAHDIDSVYLDRSYGDTTRRDVLAKLTPRGAAILTKETRAHVGRHLAVLIDGQMTLYAVLASATAPTVVLAMGVDRRRAEELVARVERARGAKCGNGAKG